MFIMNIIFERLILIVFQSGELVGVELCNYFLLKCDMCYVYYLL